MFQSLREELEAAFREDDRLRLELEQSERISQAQPEPAKPKAQPQQSQRVATMDAETQRAWEKWCDDRVCKLLAQNSKPSRAQ